MQPQATTQTAQKSPISWGWIASSVILMMIISLPTIIVLGIGMLPTIVAKISDRSEQGYVTFCVGGLNMAGVYPYLLTIWFENHSIRGAMELMSDVFVLVVMYSSATFGWLLYQTIPPVVAAFLTVLAERRVGVLRANQTKIIDEWDEKVIREALESYPEDVVKEHLNSIA